MGTIEDRLYARLSEDLVQKRSKLGRETYRKVSCGCHFHVGGIFHIRFSLTDMGNYSPICEMKTRQ